MKKIAMPWFEDIQSWLTLDGKNPPKESLLAVRSSQIVGFLPFPLLICDARFRIVGANHAFKRLFHQGDDEPEGKNISKVLGTAAGNINSAFLAKKNPKTLKIAFRNSRNRVFHVSTWRLSGRDGGQGSGTEDRRRPPGAHVAF
jgi:PAS domain-containing protein